jgi:phenylacetate-coenzyme A ligase PaaK-like adenylate-forming protein
VNKVAYDVGLPLALALAVDARRTARDAERLARKQRTRLARLLTHAHGHSRFYRELYGGDRPPSPEDLSSLPPVTKPQVLERFDDVVTDPRIDLRAVLEFVDDPSNLGRTFSNRYFVARTSGTTGLVGHYVHDLFSYFLCHALTAARSPSIALPKAGRRGAPRPRRLRVASVLSPTANFGVASVVASAPKFVRSLTDLRLFDIFDPWEKVVDGLNDFQPDVLGSFASVLEQLASARREGTLRIEPQTVRSGGEVLGSRARDDIAAAFGCPVFDAYGCAECGWLGMECRERQGLHVFSDWFIVEAVDERGREVPAGEESDKVLVTNLANRVQPFIRFELPDRVTLFEGVCSCGSVLPRLSVQGRSSEILYFIGSRGEEVRVPPSHLATLAEMVPGIQRYQVVQEDDATLLVLFTSRAEADELDVETRLRADFEAYLRRTGLLPRIEVTVRRSETIERDRSGKIRPVFSKVR